MPETLHLDGNSLKNIQRAAALLRSGGLVAFPTETVYGLGAHAFSAEAVRGIFVAKQRPAWDPLIVHIPEFDSIDEIARVDPEHEGRVRALAEAFWPGPLTLLLPRSPAIPDEVTAGRAKVGVRVPAHPVAQALLRAAGVPVAAPSANRFGHTSPTTAQHVLDDLRDRIDAVLDGGPTVVGLESTVLDPTTTPMLVYRAGAVTTDMLADATGIRVEMFTPVANTVTAPEALPSPGVGLRHYAPDAQLILCGPAVLFLEEAIKQVDQRAGTVGVLLPRNWRLGNVTSLVIQPWGAWDDAASLGAELFAGLRALEGRGVSTIVCPMPVPGGVREALRDRLSKAARPRENA